MEEGYGLIQAGEPKAPPISLLRVPHQSNALVVAYPTFGPSTFKNNTAKMQEPYSHPKTGEMITFRAPRTSESISAVAYNFETMAKPQIFDPRWLQVGYTRKIAEGIFFNVPRDTQGNPITDEQALRSFLENGKKTNGIYLLGNGFTYAPRETFETGVQDGETFARGGLSRAMEETPGLVAKNLQSIVSKKNYPKGVNVFGWDEDSALRVASLGSDRDSDDWQLDVDGLDWDDYDGCAFGVLDVLKAPQKI